MIVTKLQGGLGNQMFQYAFGLSMALQHNCGLYFDPSFFKLQSGKDDIASREFELNIFDVQIKIAGEELVEQFLHPGVMQRIFNKTGINRKRVFREKSLRFDGSVFQIPPPVYAQGFWSSEFYFSKFESPVRKAFTLKKAMSNLSQKLAARMAAQENPVSVHVRRGDYVSSERTNQIHGTCSVSYYTNSIARLKAQINNPHFYFFSDDPEWVKSNLLQNIDNYTQVEHNTASDSWQDMILMSNCRHHIIANSSFSWWGAWLNPHTDKIVIAPEKWFKAPSDFFDAQDLIPAHWIKVNNE